MFQRQLIQRITLGRLQFSKYSSYTLFNRFNSTNTSTQEINNVSFEQFQNELDQHREKTMNHVGHIKNKTIPNYNELSHPNAAKYQGYNLPHTIWTEEEMTSITQTHHKPSHLVDWCSYLTVQALRFTWDITTGYFFGKKLGLTKFSHRQWLLRLVFLETVAGVPGMMFAMVRHLKSLRRMQRDYGWIHTLLEEAENERMHLLIALQAYKPGLFVRSGVIAAQGLMSVYLFLMYIINPTYCHRLVGYLEEEAVKTYTVLLDDIDSGKYPMFKEMAQNLPRQYYRLPEDGTWRDVFAQMRADEAQHRDVNHTLAPLAKENYAFNPIRMQEVDKKNQNNF